MKNIVNILLGKYKTKILAIFLASAVAVPVLVTNVANIKHTYKITFKDYDGSVIEVIEVKKGQIPEYNAIPTRMNDGNYTYTFKSWDKPFTEVIEDDVYIATYNRELIYNNKDKQIKEEETTNDDLYLITFLDEDGTLLFSSNYKYGDLPIYIAPSKIKGKYQYIFKSWEPSLQVVTGSKKYKATYNTQKIENDDGVVLETISYVPTSRGSSQNPSNPQQDPTPQDPQDPQDPTPQDPVPPTPTFTVDFDVNGKGEAPASQTIELNSKVTKPANPKETGYVLENWYKESGCTNLWDFDNDVITEDTTLYAKWEYKTGIYIDGVLQKELKASDIGSYIDDDFVDNNIIKQENIDIVLPEGPKGINDGAFLSVASYLKTIVIPKSMEWINDNAFYHCEKLESVTILSGSASSFYVGTSAFSGCKSLVSVILPNNTGTIFENAFMDCTKLKTITLPNKVKYIKDNAFRGCTSLETIVIPNSVKEFGTYAFYNCSKLSVDIPSGVETIGSYAFYNVSHINYSGSLMGMPWGAKSYN